MTDDEHQVTKGLNQKTWKAYWDYVVQGVAAFKYNNWFTANRQWMQNDSYKWKKLNVIIWNLVWSFCPPDHSCCLWHNFITNSNSHRTRCQHVSNHVSKQKTGRSVTACFKPAVHVFLWQSKGNDNEEGVGLVAKTSSNPLKVMLNVNS